MTFEAIKQENKIVDFICRYANDASTELVGLDRKDLIGSTLLTRFPGNRQFLFGEYIKITENGGVFKRTFPFSDETLPNKWYTIIATKHPYFNGFIVMFLDVTKEKNLERELKYDATHDFLTNILNRRGLIEEITVQNYLQPPFFIGILDLDDFKFVNDQFGYAEGDLYIKKVSVIIKNQSALVSRFGGDEFVFIVYDIGCVENILGSINELIFIIDNVKLKASGSVGLFEILTKNFDLNSALTKANIALKLAKTSGKNQIKTFSGITTTPEFLTQISWQYKIEEALKSDTQLKLNLEHIVPLKNPCDDKLNAYEVLIRFLDNNSEITAGRFIPYISSNPKLMIEMDNWVIKQSFKALSVNPKKYLTINLSAPSIHSPILLPYIQDLIIKFDIKPNQIGFEITENGMIDLITIQTLIQKLVDMGCSILVDDFGSGNASLKYLSSLDSEILTNKVVIKIDGSYIKSICSNPTDRAIVRSVFSFCNERNIPVIVEWVSSKEIESKVIEIADPFSHLRLFGQGFLYKS